MTKLERIFVAVICLFVALTNNAGVLAADVIQRLEYSDSNNCQGTPSFTTNLGVANQCFKKGAASAMFTCTESRTYVSGTDCTGVSVIDAGITECRTADFSTQATIHKCSSFPDHLIAKVEIGEACTDTDEVAFASYSEFLIMDTCKPVSTGSDGLSFKLVLTDSGVDFTLFPGTTDCTGDSEVLPVNKIGTCALISAEDLGGLVSGRRLQDEEEFKVAFMISPGVNGATLGKPNSATASSVSISALVSVMVGALALIF